MRFRLLAVLLGVAAMGACEQQAQQRGGGPAIVHIEGPIAVNVDCPPSDGYTWQAPTRPAPPRAYWIVTGREDVFRDTCQSSGATACVDIRGDVAIAYSRVPMDWLDAALIRHEQCHLIGWTHTERVP